MDMNFLSFCLYGHCTGYFLLICLLDYWCSLHLCLTCYKALLLSFYFHLLHLSVLHYLFNSVFIPQSSNGFLQVVIQFPSHINNKILMAMADNFHTCIIHRLVSVICFPFCLVFWYVWYFFPNWMVTLLGGKSLEH